MMTVRQTQGKLCEVVYADPMTADELTTFTMEMRRIVGQTKTPLVFLTDWRQVSATFSRSMADTLVWVMRRDNPMVAFNGFLVSPGNVAFHRQVDNILKQAQNPMRKLFTSESQLLAAMDPLLNAPERARLREVLKGPTGTPTPSSRRSIPPPTGR